MIGLSYSCSGNENIHNESDLEIISHSSGIVEEMISSNVADSIRYIPLETMDECLIMDIEQIKTDGDYLVIKDDKNLYVFRDNGTFVSKIGEKGLAPGNYISILGFYLNRNEKNVVIIDNMKSKALKYAYTGEYLGEVDLDDSFLDLNFCEMSDNNMLLTNNLLPSPYTQNPYEYQLFECKPDEFSLKESIFTFNLGSGDVTTSRFSYYPISYHKGHMLFMANFSNILYEFTDKIKPQYIVESVKDFPDEKYLDENKDVPLMELRKKLNEKGLSTGIRAVRELPQYILLCIDNGTLIWDKKNKKGVYNNIFEYDELELLCNLAAGVTAESYSGGLIRVLESDIILDQKKVIENGANNELKQILNNTKMGDNPILSILYLNDHFVMD